MILMYPRTVKVRSSSGTVTEYVRVVEAFREDGKVKQRVVADLGRKDLLVDILPKLKRLLTGDGGQEDTIPADPEVVDASMRTDNASLTPEGLSAATASPPCMSAR